MNSLYIILILSTYKFNPEFREVLVVRLYYSLYA